MSEITEQSREDQIGAILLEAFKNASKLKLNKTEAKTLMKAFPDGIVEILEDGGIYVPHVYFSKRLNAVFGPAQWILVCRRHAHDKGSNTVRAEYVLVVRGCAVGEETCDIPFDSDLGGEDQNYGNALASLRGRALRRICSLTLSCGAELYEPSYQLEWCKKHAIEYEFKQINRMTGQPETLMLWKKKGTAGRKSEVAPSLPPSKAPAKNEYKPEDLNAMINAVTDLGAENVLRFAIGAGFVEEGKSVWEWNKSKVFVGPAEIEKLRALIKSDIEKHGETKEAWKSFRIPITLLAGELLGNVGNGTLHNFWKDVDGKTHPEFRAALDQAGKEKGFTVAEKKTKKK